MKCQIKKVTVLLLLKVVWPQWFLFLKKVYLLSRVDKQSHCCVSSVGLPREPSIPPKGLLLVTHEPNSVNTAPGPHIRGSTLRAFAAGEKEVDLILPGTARLVTSL